MNPLPKQQLLRYASNPAQLAFARRFTYADGMAQGMDAIDVKSGAGLRFTVLADRGLDLYEMEYKGLNLSFLNLAGPVSGSRFIPSSNEFTAVMNGGMLFTAGLMNVGGGCADDDGTVHGLHGKYDGMAAREVSANTIIADDGDLITTVSGKMIEARLFGEKLEMSRTITTQASKPCVHIQDTLFNARPISTEFELLYHINIGYPFLDESVTVHTAESRVLPRNDDAAKGMVCHNTISAPVDNCPEQVFFHEITPDNNGYCYALAWNHNRQLAFYVRYLSGELTHLCQWKSMQSGDYVLGLEPSNNYLNSRKGERENGTLKSIAGFETKTFDVMIGILDGADEIAAFMAEHNMK